MNKKFLIGIFTLTQTLQAAEFPKLGVYQSLGGWKCGTHLKIEKIGSDFPGLVLRRLEEVKVGGSSYFQEQGILVYQKLGTTNEAAGFTTVKSVKTQNGDILLQSTYEEPSRDPSDYGLTAHSLVLLSKRNKTIGVSWRMRDSEETAPGCLYGGTKEL